MKKVLSLVLAVIGFVVSCLSAAYYSSPKLFAETFQRYFFAPVNVAGNYLANQTIWFFEHISRQVQDLPMFYLSIFAAAIFFILTVFFAVLLAKESSSFRKWVGFVGFVYAAVIAYLCHTNYEFQQAKKLLLPLAAIIAVLIIIAAVIARAAERVGILPIERGVQPKKRVKKRKTVVKAPRKIRQLLQIIYTG